MFKLFTFMCIVTSFNVIACSDTSVEAVDAFFQKLSMIEIREGVINSNIQNAQTTRTATGGPYKVRVIKGCESGSCTIKILKKEVVFKYEPNHPDVDERGYVAYPNINVVQEMEKLIKVVRAKEYLMASMPVSKTFFYSKEITKYLDKYPALKANYDFDQIIKN